MVSRVLSLGFFLLSPDIPSVKVFITFVLLIKPTSKSLVMLVLQTIRENPEDGVETSRHKKF